MNISKKWQVAAAAAIAIGLVAGGSVSATAAPGDPIVNPQSNGSPTHPQNADVDGTFYLFDENAELSEDSGKVFDRFQYVFAASDNVDYLSEIDPDDYAAPGSWDTVYKFIAKPSEMTGGTGSWRAYTLDAAAGPNGGVLTPALELASFGLGNAGGIDSVFTEGGDWYVGLAFTTNAGVTPVGSVYRTITVNAANDTYTYAPIEYDAAPEPVLPVITAQPASTSVAVGENATFTAVADNDTSVKWQSLIAGGEWTDVAGATTDTLTVANAQIANTGTQYRAVFTNAEGSVESNVATLTVTPEPIGESDEPTDATDAATKKTATSAEGAVTLTGVPAGTYNAYAFSVPTSLGSVTVPATGEITVPLPVALHGAQHTVALFQPGNNELVAWGNVLVAPVTGPDPTLTSNTQLSAEVTVSGKFSLEGVNQGPINLGTAKRGATTAPVALGSFIVTDDRDDLKGWTLNAGVATFKNAANDEIPATALGITPKKVGGPVDGVSNTNGKIAGDAWTSTLIAEGAVGSYTPETGTQFDADLTFKAPASAKKGTYTSTLTLTLASK